MIKVNEYLGGKVKSLGAEYKGEYFTSGVMLPGEYKFNTEKEEHIIVTLGEMEILVPGGSWKVYSQGKTAVIPPKVEFQLRIRETVAYVCLYK
jgi:purine/pyrimidine-nucleoside phosphorylase